MKPEKITFYAYADNPDEAAALQRALFTFVMDQYNKGTFVRADRITEALQKFGNNPLITNFFK